MMYVCNKGKGNYLIEEITTPTKEYPEFKTWKANNMMVI